MLRVCPPNVPLQQRLLRDLCGSWRYVEGQCTASGFHVMFWIMEVMDSLAEKVDAAIALRHSLVQFLFLPRRIVVSRIVWTSSCMLFMCMTGTKKEMRLFEEKLRRVIVSR